MIKSDFWHFQAVYNGQTWYILKKSKSLAPFWRFDRSDFKLQNTPPGGGHLEKSHILYCSDD